MRAHTPQTKTSARAILIGLALIPLNCYWVTVVEVRWYSMDGSCLPLFVTPVFLLLMVTALSIAAGRVRASWRLAQAELLTIYIMLVISETLCGHDTMQNLFGLVTHPAWYVSKNPELKWPQSFFQFLPKHLIVWDVDALAGFYEGNSNPWSWNVLKHWVAPLAWWGLFFSVLVVMFLCINLLVRKHWTEQERLSFPIIQLPLAMTEGGAGSFFRSRLMWIGFSVAMAIGVLNGVHQLYPAVPFLAIRYAEINPQFRTPPWNASGGFPMSLYPFAIGLAYFLPLDLAFSCWFFYVLRKFEFVGSAALGWDRFQDFPYINEQASGAWIALALLALWGLRHFLRELFSVVRGRAAAQPGEAARYRAALAGLVAGAAFIFWFWRSAGMSLWVLTLFFGIYFLLSLAMTRVRAEFGAPHEIYFVNPGWIMVSIFGTDVLGPRDLTLMSMMHWMNRCYRNHPMPNQLEAFKMGEGHGISAGRIVGIILLATFVSLVATYWANLHEGYSQGAEAKSVGFKNWAGGEAFGRLQSWIEFGQKVEGPRTTAMWVGFGGALLLGFLRSRYTWWWFHPAGYALGMSFAMDYFWFAFCVSWMIKLLLIRYGGMRLHRRAIPFFLGLILGDYTIGSLWAAYGPLRGFRTYKIFIAGW